MLDRPAPAIDLSIEALKANLQRLQREWDTYQSTRDRDAIYGYLTAVFELVTVWAHEGTAVDFARWALWLRGHRSAVVSPEPFAAVIFCTADRQKVDYRTRSKWSRVLRYAAEYKDLDEPLATYIKRKGGINKCAGRFARRLGRGGRTANQTTFKSTSLSGLLGNAQMESKASPRVMRIAC